MWNGTTQGAGAERSLTPPTWAQALVLVLSMFPTALISGCSGVVSAGGPPPNQAPSPAFTLNPGKVDFGNVAMGYKVPQPVSIVNTGNTGIQITALTVSSPAFSVTGATLPLSLGVGQTANLSVWFDGATPGKATGTLTAQASAGAAPQVADLSGAVVSFSVAPSSLNFSAKAGTAITQNLLISNTSGANVTISQINSNAKDVTVSGVTLPVTLIPSQSVNLTVQFKPLVSETVTGNITLLDSQSENLAVNVTASGTQGILTASPSRIAFGSVVSGVTNTQPVQITNTGNDTLTITQATLSGSGFFSIGGLNVPMVLTAGQSIGFNVLFAPQLAGSIAGSLRLDSDGSNSPSTLAFSGTGVNAVRTLSVSQARIDFGNVMVGSLVSQQLTLTNTGNSNVTISQTGATGAGFSLAGAATPLVLTPGQGTSITVNFDPTAGGNASGSVGITSDANGSPLTVALSGSGAVLSPHTVFLTWGASPSTVAGYYVYRSTVDGGGYAKLDTSSVNALDYTDSAVLTGTTYFYVTTAVDNNGIESVYSDQASAIIP